MVYQQQGQPSGRRLFSCLYAMPPKGEARCEQGFDSPRLQVSYYKALVKASLGD